MGSLKPLDRIQIYVGSADRVSGTTGNFAVQASNQLFHSPNAVYKLYLQQVVMRNAFEGNVGAAGKIFGLGQTLVREVYTGSDDTFTLGIHGSGYTPQTFYFPAGTYNPTQLASEFTALATGFPSSTIVTAVVRANNTLQFGVIVSGVPMEAESIDISFPTTGSAGALMGFGSQSAGSSFSAVRTTPGPVCTDPAGGLPYFFTIPPGQPIAAQIVASLNAQGVSNGSNFTFSIDAATSALDFAVTGGTLFDVDLRYSGTQLQSLFGYPSTFVVGTTGTQNKLTDQTVLCVNIHTSPPTSHYVVAGGQLALTNLTASVPVLVGAAQPIVYTDLKGANASFEKGQDRLVNMSFRVSDETGTALVPSDDWYAIVTVDVLEDISNRETALLAEANELSKERLRLDRIALTGYDYTAEGAAHTLAKRAREAPMFA